MGWVAMAIPRFPTLVFRESFRPGKLSLPKTEFEQCCRIAELPTHVGGHESQDANCKVSARSNQPIARYARYKVTMKPIGSLHGFCAGWSYMDFVRVKLHGFCAGEVTWILC